MVEGAPLLRARAHAANPNEHKELDDGKSGTSQISPKTGRPADWRQAEDQADIERESERDPLQLIAVIIVAAGLTASAALLIWALSALFSPADAETPFSPDRAVDGRIKVQDCLGGGLVEHLYDLERARDQGIEIELSGAVMSACTHALRYENVSWGERTTFCLHAADRRGLIDRRETVAGWARLPAGVQALLPDPETVGLAYTCLPGETVRGALER